MPEQELVGIMIAAVILGSLVAVGIAMTRASAARSVRSRSNPAEMFLCGNDGSEQLTEDELYGLGHVPWNLWDSLAFLAGALFAYHLVRELSSVLVIWGVAGALISRVVRAYMVSRRQADIDRQVRDLVSLVWRALALGSELGAALNEIVPLLRPGAVGERLQYHLERHYALDPAHVIERLARDIRSSELEGLALGARAAARANRGCQAIVLCLPATLTCRYSDNACPELVPTDTTPLITDLWQALITPKTLPIAQAVGQRTATDRLTL